MWNSFTPRYFYHEKFFSWNYLLLNCYLDRNFLFKHWWNLKIIWLLSSLTYLIFVEYFVLILQRVQAFSRNPVEMESEKGGSFTMFSGNVSGRFLELVRKGMVFLRITEFTRKTRMHSSRMRTARAFTVCRNLLPGGGGAWSRGVGVYLAGPGGGVPAWSGGDLVPGGGYLAGPGGTWSRGGYLPGLVRGGVPAWSWGCTCLVLPPPPPWTEWQTGVKILPWPKLRLRAVTIKYCHH